MICNADESEPGTFKDRLVLEGDPFSIIEAMTIAGYAINAQEGYIYIRGEYPLAYRRIENAIQQAEEYGLLGDHIFGTDFSFHIHTHAGAGAYICGEETALIESLEGKRGMPRARPPYPDDLRPVRQANGREQRGDAGQCAADPAQRRGMVSRDRFSEERGDQGLYDTRATSISQVRSKSRWGSRCVK